MKLFNTIRGLVLGSLVICSGIANANVIEFGGSDSSSFNFNFRTFENVVGTTDLTITAGVFSNNSNLITLAGFGEDDRRFGTEVNGGLGVLGTSGEDDNADIDGRGNNDVVIFTFSEQVSFLGLNFGNVDAGDDFEFGLVNGDTFERILSNEDVTQDFFSLESPLVGTTFAVGAEGRFDDFIITSITAVPEPTTIAIFALGLMGLGLRSRRSL